MKPAYVQRIDTLVDQGFALSATNPGKATQLATEALTLATEAIERGEAYPLGEANARAALSWLYQDRGDYEQAIQCANEAITQFEAADVDEIGEYAHTLGVLGISYYRLGNPGKSLQYFLAQLTKSQQTQDRSNEARAHLGLGLVYTIINDFELANKHELLSYRMYCELGDIERQATALNNLCFSAVERSDYEEAIDYGLKGLALDPDGDKVGSIYVYLIANVAQAYLGLNDVDAATVQIERAQALCQKIPDRFLQVMVLIIRAKIYACVGNTQVAIDHFLQVVAQSEAASIHDFTKEGHFELYKLYKQIEQFDRAMHHHEQHHAAAIQVLQHESSIKLQAMTTAHQIEQEQKEAEILRLKTVELQAEVEQQTAQLRNSLSREQQLAQQLRTALERADMLNQLKSRVIKVVSHEFRTPLTVISGSAGLLDHHLEKMSTEKRHRHVANIQRAIANLSYLVNDIELVGNASIERGASALEKMPLLEMCELLAEQVMELDTNPSRLQVMFSSSVNDATIQSDQVLILKMCEALIINALKFSEDTVVVRFSAEKSHLHIRITDRGIGIPAGELTSIFNLLERGTNVGTIRGLGVGLFLAKQLADVIGAQIQPESAGPDQGATFTLSIPLHTDTPHLAPHPEALAV